MKRIILITLFIIQSIISLTNASAQNFQIKEISDKIFIVIDPHGGENQLVIKSKKGLVVFNTFWSEITAQKYKKEIAKAFNRDDFTYTHRHGRSAGYVWRERSLSRNKDNRSR